MRDESVLVRSKCREKSVRNKYSIYQKSHYIVSPIAVGSQANFDAIRAGKSCLQAYQGHWGIPEPFFASIFQDDKFFNDIAETCQETAIPYTRFERIAIKAAKQAIAEAGIDASSDRVLFVLSTTKGNVEFLENNDNQQIAQKQVYLWHSAQVIAAHFGNHNTPIVVSNACISGCAAQITAFNMLQYGEKYDYVVVIGAEVLSKFIIAGFQSFKALSPERCKPFDQNRCGLNLGEAAAAIVYARTEFPEELPDQTVLLEAGAINNDANHISGPSRTGEGLLRSINKAIENFDIQRIAFINAHGTATLYNDDMESVAINRAGLQDIPVNSLKGYYGHTLGAAGVMEVILSSIALQNGMVLKTIGNKTPGTAQPLKVSLDNSPAKGDAFLKLISGFGGSNAAVLFSIKNGKQGTGVRLQVTDVETQCIASLQQEEQDTGIRLQVTDNKEQDSGCWEQIAEHHLSPAPCNLSPDIDEHLAQLYRDSGMSYPKFFKMDRLCKAGILGAEMLLKDYDFDRETVKADWGIILMNSASSLDNDRHFQETITEDNYYPSPAVFVYTLANIVTGEIAIRHKIGGESSFYVMPEFDQDLMEESISQAFAANPELTHIICGWVDVDGGICDVRMFLCRRRGSDRIQNSKFKIQNSNFKFQNSKKNNNQNKKNMEELIYKLKEEIIDVLNLEGMKPEDIDENAPLFGEGLGLDSIDALELIVLMEKNYGIKLRNANEGKEIFKSVRVMAEYIHEHRTK